jgi:hypothetical protein
MVDLLWVFEILLWLSMIGKPEFGLVCRGSLGVIDAEDVDGP